MQITSRLGSLEREGVSVNQSGGYIGCFLSFLRFLLSIALLTHRSYRGKEERKTFLRGMCVFVLCLWADSVESFFFPPPFSFGTSLARVSFSLWYRSDGFFFCCIHVTFAVF